MKKLIIIFFLIPLLGNAQDYYLPLQKDPFSGLYHLNASLNGIEGKFIFDTGASGIVVNSNFFSILVNQAHISQPD